MIRVWFDTVQASVGEKQREVWVQGLEMLWGVLGKVSGEEGKSHGRLNRKQGLEGNQ